MTTSMAEKTHDPTAKRLREARAKGDVPQAPLVAGAIGLLAMIPLVRVAIERITRDTARSLMDLSPVTAIDPWKIALAVIAASAPVAIVLLAIAVVAGIAQGSVTFSPSRLAPDASKLEPFSGLGRLIDRSRMWAALRGLLVAVLLVAVLGRIVLSAALSGARSLASERAIGDAIAVTTRVMVTAGAIACVFAVLDAIVARRMWLGRLKMSRDEVVREHKEGEGDPEVKRRREELHHDLMAAEALTAVRDATVVVINPTHLACALRYGADAGDDDAPTLVAKGHGALAARMIEAAKLHGVPVIQDVPVARALYELEVGIEIPEALYEAVAEVLRAAWEPEA
jgi:flagellar biosynthesis protein FlhB